MKPYFGNPHYHCAPLIARGVINATTLLWSLLVLFAPLSLPLTPYGGFLLRFFPGYVYAAGGIAVSAIMLYRLFTWHKPNYISTIGYGMHLSLWLAIWLPTVSRSGPIYLTPASTGTLALGFAFWAFISRPRRVES